MRFLRATIAAFFLFLSRSVFLAFTVLAPLSASAVDRCVWRIGSFDNSAAEFRSEGIDYSDPKQDIVFKIGESKAIQWPRFHPGSANGFSGRRAHPFTIVFDESARPTGVYRLRLRATYVTQGLPSLRVEVNGHAGTFYFHPKLEYKNADWEGTYVPQTSSEERVIEFPSSWVQQGQNKIVITATDDSRPEDKATSSAPRNSGIVYDALELLNDSNRRYNPQALTATVTPSVFYRQGASGLTERVEVVTSVASRTNAVTIRLSVLGKEYSRTIRPDGEFGEIRTEFDVPEWNGSAKAYLKVSADDRSRRFKFDLTAAKKWTVYVVPHEHLDIGFTDYAAKVAELHSQAIDGAAESIKRVPDFRWTPDGFWVLKQYMKGRSPEKQNELLSLLRDGKIVVPPQYANQHTGTASLESLARSFYEASDFAKRNNLPIGAAHIVDVPTYTWSYASLLHDAGIKYFLAGSNNWRAPILMLARWNERSPFYWEGPDGKKVLMWYARAYWQLTTLFGDPPTIAAAYDSLPIFLQAYSHSDYKSHSTIIFGSQLENTVFSKHQADFANKWNAEFAYPKMVVSTVGDAMASIERERSRDFPVVRGDFGPYWEDGFGSDAAATAIHRHNQQRIVSAEKLAAMTNVFAPSLRPDSDLLASAWENILLFDEHTWTFAGATSQPDHEQTVNQAELKRSRVIEARRQIAESTQRSWAQFGALLNLKDSAVVVFNPSNWQRDGLVTVDIGDAIEILDPITGAALPLRVLAVGRGKPLQGFGGGYRKVQFLARDVRAMGYKAYAFRFTKEKPPEPAPTTAAGTIENEFYRITLDQESGAIRSIFDKQLNREMVDTSSPYRFGSFLYVTGPDELPNNSLYRYAAGPAPKLEVHPAGRGRIVSVEKAPFGTFAILESQTVNTPLVRTEIRVFDHVKNIELAYHIRKDDVLTKEAAYIAFPFAVSEPSFAYSNQTGWVDPARDMLAGASREWFTPTHWAAVHDASASAAVVPIDAPLITFGDIVRGNWPEQFRPGSPTIFSWVMNNYWQTNFVSHQGGEFTFRYAISTDPSFDSGSLTRFATNELVPLESTTMGASPDPGILPASGTSILALNAPNAVVSAWKPATNGNGTIVRVQETAGRKTRLQIASELLRIDSAWRCSLVEDDQDRIPVSAEGVEIDIGPYEVLTLRLKTSIVNSTTAAAH